MDKIGVFGGTFNPVHKGHETAAIDFYNTLKLDKLLVIPSNIPPHKQIDSRITAEERFFMCALCFEKYKDYFIKVSDLEIKKNGVSYTFDTLTELKKEYVNEKLYFLLGSDMFLYLENWYEYKNLIKLCAFAVVLRAGHEKKKVMEYREKLVKTGVKIELLETEPFEVSSTELREQIKDNNYYNLEKYISGEVLTYIKEKNIYVL